MCARMHAHTVKLYAPYFEGHLDALQGSVMGYTVSSIKGPMLEK